MSDFKEKDLVRRKINGFERVVYKVVAVMEPDSYDQNILLQRLKTPALSSVYIVENSRNFEKVELKFEVGKRYIRHNDRGCTYEVVATRGDAVLTFKVTRDGTTYGWATNTNYRDNYTEVVD